MGPYLPPLSQQLAPQCNLLKADVDFRWTESHQSRFDNIKLQIVKCTTLAYFNPNIEPVIKVDRGLGAVFLQDGRPVAFTSKTLSDTEQRCANIEWEMLAVVFGCERFHNYIYDKKTTVISDHKPLEMISQKPHCCPIMTTADADASGHQDLFCSVLAKEAQHPTGGDLSPCPHCGRWSQSACQTDARKSRNHWDHTGASEMSCLLKMGLSPRATASSYPYLCDRKSCQASVRFLFFLEYGIHERFISDNGSVYDCETFQNFTRTWNIEHITSSPRYPQANGLTECFVDTAKKTLI